jgi:hypothetical protein
METDNLPLLGLSSNQQLIIDAHIAASMQAIIDIKFDRPDKDQEAIRYIIHEQGKIAVLKNLKTYDEERFTAAQQQTPTEE